MKVTIQQVLEQYINSLTEEQCEQLTLESFLKLTQQIIRESTYKQFPATDSKVLETLLLLHYNFAKLTYQDRGIDVKTPVPNLVDSPKEEMGKEVVRLSELFGQALKETIKILAS